MAQSGARFIYNGSVFNHTIREVLLLNQMTSSHYRRAGPGPGPMRPGQDRGHWSVANIIDNCRGPPSATVPSNRKKYFTNISTDCGWLKLVGNHQQKEIIFEIFKNPIESSWVQCLATSSGKLSRGKCC